MLRDTTAPRDARQHGRLRQVMDFAAARDLTWPAGIALIILLLTLVPPTIERLAGPADRVHLETYWYVTDFPAYMAAMQEGARTGTWLVHNHFSPEPHAPAFMFPLYTTIGMLAHATGLPLIGIYVVVELLARVAYLAALYHFTRTFAGAAVRRAYVLALFAGGIGIPLALGASLLGASYDIGGRGMVELIPFGVLLCAPHLMLGLALLLEAFVLFPKAAAGSWAALGLLGATMLALSLFHPYILPVPVSVFGIAALWGLVARARGSGSGILPAGPWYAPLLATVIAGIAAAPVLLYDAWTFTFDPFWSVAYREQQRIATPPPWQFPLDFGIVLLLAPLGIVALRRAGGLEPGQRLLLAWIVAGYLWVYAPVPFQYRFAFGLPLALAMFAAHGWPLAVRGSRAVGAGTAMALRLHPASMMRLSERVTVYVLGVLAFASTAIIFMALCSSAATNFPIALYPIDRDSYAAATWMAEHTTADDVVVAAPNTGSIFAALIPGRVLMWTPITPEPERKQARITALYRGELDPAGQDALYGDYRVSYLLVGEEERLLGPYDPGAAQGYPVAFRSGTATVYRVLRPA